MAQHTFNGANPFGKSTRTAGVPGGVSKIVEEDENVRSPTDATFRLADPDRSTSFSFAEATGGDNNSSSGGPFAAGNNFFNGGGARGEGGESSGGGSGGGDASSLRPIPDESGIPMNYAMGRRTSVSAESLNPSSVGTDTWVPPYHPKTPEQLNRLKTAVAGNFLFSHLEDEQFKTVLDALVEKPIPAKDIKVVSQGDAGDYFYIVEDGSFDVFIHPSGSVQPGPDGLGTKVNTIGPGGSFGELALMYNAPRAATVVSTVPSTLWALDRVTFRTIVMESAFQRRRMYEAFLEEVPLLSSLKPYERSKIADALDTLKHPPGSTIIKEGDPGDAFYLLESGEAEAYKEGIEGPVKLYKRGDYFGELALLDDKPRAASVISKTEVKVARLGRDGFKRLLGPVEEIMRRAEYKTKPVKDTTKSEEQQS